MAPTEGRFAILEQRWDCCCGTPAWKGDHLWAVNRRAM